ncbi:MAG: hypothetical protein JWN74_2510 [Acidobacteriaceae bacterium]|nr:hypothetical protein [Acidobacteriaceae bacterium]
MLQRLRLGTVKREFSGCLFVFPYDPVDRAKFLFGTKLTAHKLLFDTA